MSEISLYRFYKLCIPYKNLIIQASDKSGKSENSDFNYSIGLSFSFINLNNSDKYRVQMGNHEKLVLCSFTVDTDWKRRKNMEVNRVIIHNNLYKNGIKNYKLDFGSYIFNLSKFKFVISPEGRGEDCHRTYEALLCGCIPIVEFNEKIQKKYQGLPILYTEDYSEITFDYLKEKYKQMILQKYNFSKLMLSYFSESDREEIKEKGNFWCKKITNKNAYE